MYEQINDILCVCDLFHFFSCVIVQEIDCMMFMMKLYEFQLFVS
jgi:hypothetical protein